MTTKEFLRPRINDKHIIAYNANSGAVTISELYGIVDQGSISVKFYNRSRTSPWSGGNLVHNTALQTSVSGTKQTSGFNDATLGSTEVLVIEITGMTSAPDKLFIAVTGDV